MSHYLPCSRDKLLIGHCLTCNILYSLADIPETIEVDISELQVNDSLAVSDIKISGDFTIENNPEDSIVTVVPPTDEPSEEEVEAMEGESATEEPEVVGEDKEDDEEENKED